jgi:glycyl-tRNA synthetase
MLKDITKLVSLSKRRGFVFQSSEVYGGLGACYDYGPLGVLLKQNLKQLWWREMVSRPQVEGLDSSILMHPKVWEASGHVENFHDPMIDCKKCKSRYREDELKKAICPNCGSKALTEPRQFNLMFKTHLGPVDDAGSHIYLRPETAQGIYVNFQNVMQTTRQKLPFGIAQIGKAFRNEITARNFIFRMREFEQMEMQFFVSPEDDTMKWFEYWLSERLRWHQQTLGFGESVQPIETPKDALAHYAKRAVDLKFNYPFGLEEIEGIHHRGDFDLKRHAEFSKKDLSVFDEHLKKRVLPQVIETSIGVDRLFLAALCSFYREDVIEKEPRSYFSFPFGMAPYDCGVFPLMKKEPLLNCAEGVMKSLLADGVWCHQDISGSIGKRYRRADEVGTPLGITIDFDSLEDQSVTIRDRDSTKQIRLPIAACSKHKLAQVYQDFRKQSSS